MSTRPVRMAKAGSGEGVFIGAAMPGLAPSAAASFRTPRSHPKGYPEALTNLHRRFASAVRHKAGGGLSAFQSGTGAALRSMALIDTSVVSSTVGGAQRELFKKEHE